MCSSRISDASTIKTVPLPGFGEKGKNIVPLPSVWRRQQAQLLQSGLHHHHDRPQGFFIFFSRKAGGNVAKHGIERQAVKYPRLHPVPDRLARPRSGQQAYQQQQRDNGDDYDKTTDQRIVKKLTGKRLQYRINHRIQSVIYLSQTNPISSTGSTIKKPPTISPISDVHAFFIAFLSP